MSWGDRDSLRTVIDRVTLTETDDSGTQQLVRAKGLADEEFRHALRINPHGFTSHAPAGSEGAVLTGGGRRDRPLILGLEHKDHRPSGLAEGESVLYDAKGQVVFLKRDGIWIHSSQDVVRAAQGRLRVVMRSNKYVQLKVKQNADPDDGGATVMHITIDIEQGEIIMSQAPIIGPDPNPQD
jgi:phage baseplate assembly protein V